MMKMNEKEPVVFFVNEELVLCFATLKCSKIIHYQVSDFAGMTMKRKIVSS